MSKALLRFGRIAVWCLALGLPACLGTAQGPGAPGAGPDGSVFSADAGGKTEAGPDVASAEDAKPHPGGVTAPPNEYEGDSKFVLVVRGGVSLCTETLHLANGTDKEVVNSRLNGRIVAIDKVNGTEVQVLQACSLRYVRVMEGEADTLQCTDILLAPDCTFQKEMGISDPGSVAFYKSDKPVDLFEPGGKPACGSGLDSDFFALKNEFDFSGLATENPPPCGAQQQRGMMKPSPSILPILPKLKNVAE
jgi:hypothetical protein